MARVTNERDAARKAIRMVFDLIERGDLEIAHLGPKGSDEEGGASLRGAGWKLIGEAGGGRWSRRARRRIDDHPTQGKLKWERAA